MKVTLKELRKTAPDRLVIESVDLSLYIAHAEHQGHRALIVGDDGRALKTRNLLDMKTVLKRINANERVLTQRSSYDEMVGHGHGSVDSTMEIPLGPGFETLPPWQH